MKLRDVLGPSGRPNQQGRRENSLFAGVEQSVKYYFFALGSVLAVFLGLTMLLTWHDAHVRAEARNLCASIGLDYEVLWGQPNCIDPKTGDMIGEATAVSEAAHSPYGMLNRQQLRQHMDANPMRSVDQWSDRS